MMVSQQVMDKVTKVVESAKEAYTDNVKVDKVKGMFSNAYTKVNIEYVNVF
jgi:hypothetical protein